MSSLALLVFFLYLYCQFGSKGIRCSKNSVSPFPLQELFQDPRNYLRDSGTWPTFSNRGNQSQFSFSANYNQAHALVEVLSDGPGTIRTDRHIGQAQTLRLLQLVSKLPVRTEDGIFCDLKNKERSWFLALEQAQYEPEKLNLQLHFTAKNNYHKPAYCCFFGVRHSEVFSLFFSSTCLLGISSFHPTRLTESLHSSDNDCVVVYLYVKFAPQTWFLNPFSD